MNREELAERIERAIALPSFGSGTLLAFGGVGGSGEVKGEGIPVYLTRAAWAEVVATLRESERMRKALKRLLATVEPNDSAPWAADTEVAQARAALKEAP